MGGLLTSSSIFNSSLCRRIDPSAMILTVDVKFFWAAIWSWTVFVKVSTLPSTFVIRESKEGCSGFGLLLALPILTWTCSAVAPSLGVSFSSSPKTCNI